MKRQLATVFFLLISLQTFSQLAYVADGQKIYQLDVETDEYEFLFEQDYSISSITINSKNEIYCIGAFNYDAYLGRLDVETQAFTVLKGFPDSYTFFSLAFDENDELYLSYEDDLNRDGDGVVKYNFETNSFESCEFTNQTISGYIDFDPVDGSLFFWKTCCGAASPPTNGIFRVVGENELDTVAYYNHGNTYVDSDGPIFFDLQGNLYYFRNPGDLYSINKATGENTMPMNGNDRDPHISFSGMDFIRPSVEEPFLTSDATAYSFGNVDVDYPARRMLRLRNVGRQQVVIDSIGYPNSPFQLNIDQSGIPLSLAELQSVAFQISFQPDRPGTFEDFIKIYWNNGQILNLQLSAVAKQFSEAERDVIYSFVEPNSLLMLDESFAQIQDVNCDTRISALSINSEGDVFAVKGGQVHLLDLASCQSQWLAHITPAVNAVFFDKNDHLYGWRFDQVDFSNHIYRYDSAIDDLVQIGEFELNGYDGQIVQSTAIDARGNAIYLLTHQRYLYKFDLETLQVTLAGSLEDIITRIFFTADGTLYGTGILEDVGLFKLCKLGGSTLGKVSSGNFEAHASFAQLPNFTDSDEWVYECNRVISKVKDDLPPDFVVYPNPFSENMPLKVTHESLEHAVLHDLSGKTIATFRESLPDGQWKTFSMTEKDAAALRPGVYILEVRLNGLTHFTRVIKE